MLWVFLWIGAALVFNAGVYFMMGGEAALQFFTGYVVEKSLSIDNLFVFSLIFAYFGTSKRDQIRALYWGIVGAMVMRLAFILLGIGLIQRFHWVVYILGAILVVSGLNFLKPVKITQFFSKNSSLFLVIVAIEITDLIFAIDSVPAILAITTDPIIAFTSNVFAILGLRSLYFVLRDLKVLQKAVPSILIFIGIKMLISGFYIIPLWAVLAVIAILIAIPVLRNRKA